MQGPEDKKNIEIESGKKTSSKIIRIVIILVIAAAAIYGYKAYTGKAANQAAMQQQPQAEPTVIVKQAEMADLSAQPSEYVGRVEAIQTVQVRPQISGEVSRVCFKEGSMVRAGQLLFEIDPAQYQATVQLRRAELEKANATLADAQKYFARVKAADARAVSAADKDTAESNVMQGTAAVSQCKANLRLAQINLDYCRITAPISGKIGIANFTKGNYVTPSTGALAQIVQMDPIRVSYSLPDRDYLDQIAQFQKNSAVYKTHLTLSNGHEITVSGQRDFEDNTVDQQTGTIMVRLRYDNSAGRLIPGEMIRVFTRSVNPDMRLVIPQAAVMADSQGDFVYVVGSDGTANMVRIKLGRENGDTREVTEGLKEGQTVVVEGLQMLRPGMKVKTSGAASENVSDSNAVLGKLSGTEVQSGSKEGK